MCLRLRLHALLVATSLHLGLSATTTTWSAIPDEGDWECGKAQEIEQAACEGVLPACQAAIDCAFGQWGDWSACTDQAKTRTRAITVHASQGGKGCSGTSQESSYCATTTATDCVWGQWSAYTTCASDYAQQERTRTVTTAAANGGAPCVGNSKETLQCGITHSPINCQLTDWHDWTTCSQTCGNGFHTRQRRWKEVAAYGGTPCQNYIKEVGQCTVAACVGAVDCVLSEWIQWVGCDKDSPQQRVRQRRVVTPNANGGKVCAGSPLEEIDKCPEVDDICTFSGWGTWSVCDVSCGTSQQRRQRTLITWLLGANYSKCADASTQETKGCNLGTCVSGTPCRLSDWTVWGTPSATCDTASKNRTRTVLEQATAGGVPCAFQSLLEVTPVTGLPACTPVDCVWGPWTQWGACSASCGGGTHRRTRRIAIAPLYDGSKSCAETENDPSASSFPFKEIGACNEQACPHNCINGTFAAWNDWQVWSATCGKPYRMRKRLPATVPNSCGMPAEGDEEEFQQSTDMAACVLARDCTLSVWSEWSACSATCFGVKDRLRMVEQFATGDGNSCNTSALVEMTPCEPGLLPDGSPESTPSSCEVLPNRSCILSSWSQWMDCPVTCGGGQHQRARRVLQPPSGGGLACTDELTQTRTCNMNKCGSHCIDCHWGQWSDWGACSKCGGQRYRFRRVEQLPNHCGTPCETRTSQETDKCSVLCTKPRWCTWGEWSAYSLCSATCGGASKQRQRHLLITDVQPTDYLFVSYHHMMCAGSRFEVAKCDGLQNCGTQVCVPTDCTFAVWSQWYAPQMSGLCQRNRVIMKNNNECGQPCDGHLIETKVCIPTSMAKRDCELSNWGIWSMCASVTAQKYKIREVFRQATNGGSADPCKGALRQTANCQAAGTVIDCNFTAWTDWGLCTSQCSGWQYRTRQGNHPPSQHGGEPCIGTLKQIHSCGQTNCVVTAAASMDCQFGVWTDWGICYNGQKVRMRVVQQRATGNGAACVGGMENTEPCGDEKIDCKVSPWTDWDTCSELSGGGQHQRHREIFTQPRNGGTACPTENSEVAPCNTQAPSSNVDCVLSEWAVWGACSTPHPQQCMGQMTRARTIVHNRQNGGKGCQNEALEETLPCGTATTQCSTVSTITNCVIGLWTAWSTCSKTCDSGHQQRTRQITLPSPGGTVCAGDPALKETQECSANRCDGTVCTDATWGAWGAWSACTSTSCPGVQSRTRPIAIQATPCGKAAVGYSEDVQACNTDKNCADTNCAVGAWADWSTCSTTCNGYTTRTRPMDAGTGNGTFCKDTLTELAACTNSTPNACPALFSKSGKDCVWADWDAWTDCTRACDGGTQNRTRTYTAYIYPGTPCTGDITSVQKCNWQNCATGSQNCVFHDWNDWGGCESIPGAGSGYLKRVETRTRSISQVALNGGANCIARDSKEQREGVAPTCGPLAGGFCVWDDWQAWSTCSDTCGTSGYRTRKRQMKTQTGGRRRLETEEYEDNNFKEEVELTLPLRYAAEDVQAFRKERVARQGDMHFQELILAFLAGGAAMFLLLGVAACSCPSKAASVEPSRGDVASPTPPSYYP